MAGGADFFRKSVASFVPDTVKTTLFTDALGYDGWAALGALEDTMQAVMWFKVLRDILPRINLASLLCLFHINTSNTFQHHGAREHIWQRISLRHRDSGQQW